MLTVIIQIGDEKMEVTGSINGILLLMRALSVFKASSDNLHAVPIRITIL